MYTTKSLKDNAMFNMHKNYWRLLGVLLIVSFILGGFRQIHIGSDVEGVVSTTNKVSSSIGTDIIGGRTYNISADDALEFILNPNKKYQIYQEAERHYSPTEGVFANLYNQVISSKSFTIGLLNSVNESFFKGRFERGSLIFAGTAILFLVWIFIYFPIEVGRSRFILENRVSEDTGIGRIRFIWMVKSWSNVVKTMCLRQVYLVLWALTIVGLIIKFFSYMMVPYILAENPRIKPNEAIKLSCDMMNGEKWKAFKIHFSFIGWYILSLFTFGLLDVLFTNIYRELTIGELYSELRSKAKRDNLKNSNLLFDDALFDNHFEGSYDMDFYPIEQKEKKKWIRLDYRKDYSITSMILMFFTFAFIGWVWEAFIYIYEQGIFVNRGTLHGPWLPIYGTGGVMVLVLLKKFRDRPGLTLFLAMILCGTLEYVTAWFLWEKYQTIWWDYNGYFLNLDGRISAEALAIFGVGAMAFIYILAPAFDRLYSKFPDKILKVTAFILIVIFIFDLGYSYKNPNAGKGITEYKNFEEKYRILMEEKR